MLRWAIKIDFYGLDNMKLMFGLLGNNISTKWKNLNELATSADIELLNDFPIEIDGKNKNPKMSEQLFNKKEISDILKKASEIQTQKICMVIRMD